MAQTTLTAVGATSAAGVCTITWPPINVGQEFTGTVSVPMSPAGIVWSINVNGQTIATTGGSSPYGNFQLTPTDTISITGSGLSPTVQYEAILVGTLQLLGAVGTVLITPTASSTEAQVYSPPPTALVPSISLPNSGSPSLINVLSTTRTLIIVVGLSGGTLTNVNVVPGVTGFAYNQAPYLRYEGTDLWTVVAPLPGIANALVTTAITLTYTGSLTEFSVWSDTVLYDESVFYNGVAQAASNVINAGGPATVITGPVRIISASLSSNGATLAFLNINGAGTLCIQTPAAGGALAETFTPNLILPAGQTMTITQSAAVQVIGTVTYAFP